MVFEFDFVAITLIVDSLPLSLYVQVLRILRQLSDEKAIHDELGVHINRFVQALYKSNDVFRKGDPQTGRVCGVFTSFVDQSCVLIFLVVVIFRMRKIKMSSSDVIF